jgi:hypothetical protein
MTVAPTVRALGALMLGVVMLGIAASSTGCDPSDPCDPGYYEEHGACYPFPAVLDAGGDAQAGDDDGGSEPDGEAPADPYEGFGDDCVEQTDCAGDLVCGGEQFPRCTQVNCMADTTICPPGWICFDTMGMSPDPSVTSVCLMF